MMSEQIDQLMTALCEAQKEIAGAVKDSTNPHYKSQYADLASVWEACRGPLTKHGLAVTQLTNSADPNTVTVDTILGHKSGQWVKSSLLLSPTKPDPQGIGSAITYARRYALAAIAGVSAVDDDGQAASAPQESNALGPLVKALEASDAWAVLDIAQNQEAFRNAFSRLGSNQKKACRELEQTAAAHCHEYVEGFAEYHRNADVMGAQQFIADLTSETAKRLVWARLDSQVKHWLKGIKDAV